MKQAICTRLLMQLGDEPVELQSELTGWPLV